MAYAIEYLPSAVRSLKKLTPPVNRRIIAKIEELGITPRGSGSIKMQGAERIALGLEITGSFMRLLTSGIRLSLAAASGRGGCESLRDSRDRWSRLYRGFFMPRRVL